MKVGWVIAGGIVVVGGVAGYYFYQRQITALENTDYKIIGVKILQATTDLAIIELTLRLTSKSRIEAEIKDFYFEVYLDDKKVASIQPSDVIILPAMGYADGKFTVKFSPRELGLDVLSLLTNYLSKKDVAIKVSGNAKIRSAVFALPGTNKPIPIYVTVTVPIEYDTSLKEQLSFSPT